MYTGLYVNYISVKVGEIIKMFILVKLLFCL